VLQAMTGNSPYFGGTDTGHASWRAVLWNHWPSTGPTPYFTSAAEYDRAVAELVAAGVLLDEGMVYWYVRPSVTYPTVEVRVGDVCLTVAETILVAALVRGLVGTALTDIAAGRPPPPVRERLLAAAHWRAGLDGLEGESIDPVRGTLVPAWQLVDRLLWTVRAALARSGDLETVRHLVRRLRQTGSGAARQRQAYLARHDLRDVLEFVTEETVRAPALG
jgi:carboxylate-amine ligase